MIHDNEMPLDRYYAHGRHLAKELILNYDNVSLADVLRYTRCQTADFHLVKVGWLNGQMFISIQK